MENTDKIVKIDTKIQIKIFAAYIACSMEHRYKKMSLRTIISVGGFDSEPYIVLRLQCVNPGNAMAKHIKDNDWSLLLKPLSLITEEHKVELERICNMPKNTRGSLQQILFDLKNGTAIIGPNVIWVQIIIDQCREWGYALPYGPHSVEQLVEAGIYKLVE